MCVALRQLCLMWKKLVAYYCGGMIVCEEGRAGRGRYRGEWVVSEGTGLEGRGVMKERVANGKRM